MTSYDKVLRFLRSESSFGFEHHNCPQLTPEVKNKIFGENAARIFGLDIAATRRAVEGDLLYRLRDDGNAAPSSLGPL